MFEGIVLLKRSGGIQRGNYGEWSWEMSMGSVWIRKWMLLSIVQLTVDYTQFDIPTEIDILLNAGPFQTSHDYYSI